MLRPFAHRSGARPDVPVLRTLFWETVTLNLLISSWEVTVWCTACTWVFREPKELVGED
jgi:hypothetical protein